PERRSETAADLMIPVSLTIPDATTIYDALALLNDQRLSVAPVVDSADQPIGIIRRHTLQHQGENNHAHVRKFMTPVFFSVRPEAPAAKVIEEIRFLHLHNLFVIDNKVLAGVICDTDILPEIAAVTGASERSGVET